MPQGARIPAASVKAPETNMAPYNRVDLNTREDGAAARTCRSQVLHLDTVTSQLETVCVFPDIAVHLGDTESTYPRHRPGLRIWAQPCLRKCFA